MKTKNDIYLINKVFWVLLKENRLSSADGICDYLETICNYFLVLRDFFVFLLEIIILFSPNYICVIAFSINLCQYFSWLFSLSGLDKDFDRNSTIKQAVLFILSFPIILIS